MSTKYDYVCGSVHIECAMGKGRATLNRDAKRMVVTELDLVTVHPKIQVPERLSNGYQHGR